MKTGKNKTMGALHACLLLATLLAANGFAGDLTPTKLGLDYGLTHADDDLQPGDSGVLTIVVKNLGGQNAEKTEVYIPDAGDLRISKREYLGTLKPGETRSISAKYTVASNASIGLKTIKINAVYDGFDSYGKPENDKRESWELNVNVKGDSVFVMEGVEAGGIPTPGSTVTLKALLKNRGIGDAYDTEAQLSIPTSLVKVLGAEKKYLGDIKSGEETAVEFTLYLDSSLPTGAYSLPLVLGFKDRDHNAATATLPVGLQVIGETRFSLTVTETDPKGLHADDKDIEIKMKFDNTGTNDLKNVRVTYQPSEPLKNALSFVQSKDLGTVKASDSTELSFYADIDEDAKAGRTKQAFLVEYTLEGRDANITLEIPIDIKQHPQFELAAEDLSAAIGSTASLRMTVENTGSKCESVTVWAVKKSGQPFDFEEKSAYIGDLDEGESGEAVIGFTVESDAKAQEYILPIEIRCTTDGDVLVYGKSVRINVTEAEGAGNMQYLLPALGIVLASSAALWMVKKRKNPN